MINARSAHLLLMLFLAVTPCVAGDAPLAPKGAAVAAEAVPAEEPVYAPARDPKWAEAEEEGFKAVRPDPKEATAKDGAASAWMVVLRIAVSLALLTAMVVGGALLIKRFLPGRQQLLGCPAMEVLGRMHLDTRRYVALMRVGERVLTVGVSPEGLRVLAEASDKDEVAGLLCEARPKTEAGKTVFQRLLGRPAHHVDASVESGEMDAGEASSGGDAARLAREMEGIHASIRGLRAER